MKYDSYYRKAVISEIRRMRPQEKKYFRFHALTLGDIDCMPLLYDRYYHRTGDMPLCSIFKALTECTVNEIADDDPEILSYDYEKLCFLFRVEPNVADEYYLKRGSVENNVDCSEYCAQLGLNMPRYMIFWNTLPALMSCSPFPSVRKVGVELAKLL